MAKFLDTTGVSYHLQQLINQAQETLILISPFLKVAERLRQSLEDKDRLKIDIRFVYGKSELQLDEIRWLKDLKSVRTAFCHNLHAKCYLNEKEAIITSMNLYEFSQVNNQEMGVLVAKEDDAALYANIREEANRLFRMGEEVRLSAERVTPPSEKTAPAQASGSCIRCKASIPLSPDHPYCTDCYKVWKRYENPTYAEKHCHACGGENASTFAKPICYACFKRGKSRPSTK